MSKQLHPDRVVGKVWVMDYIPHNRKAGIDIEGEKFIADHPWAGMWIVCPKDESCDDYGVYGSAETYEECRAAFDKLESSNTNMI